MAIDRIEASEPPDHSELHCNAQRADRNQAHGLLIVDLHPALVVGGCEHFLRRLCVFAGESVSVSWYGASREFYRFLEVVYRVLGLRASPLRLAEGIVEAMLDIFSFKDLVPFSSRWRAVRRRFEHASAVYVKNEFLELLLTYYFGGWKVFERVTIGMHTPIKLGEASGTWSRVHDHLYRNHIYRSFLRHARMIHAPSSSVYDDIAYVFSNSKQREQVGEITKKVCVIPNGIRIGDEPTPLHTHRIRALAVGRICKQKGFDRLATALHDVDCDLTVVGDGDEAQSVRESLNDRAMFLGAISAEDVLAQMRLHDLLLMPSRWENQPFTLLEAMSCGLFPVVQDLPQLTEQLPLNYRWLAVDYEDPDSVAACITRLNSLKTDRTAWEFARYAIYQHAKASFDELATFDKLVEILVRS